MKGEIGMAYFVTDDNCKLYYEEKGTGEPLIFVHGWTCNRKFFKKQVSEFASEYHVISYDLRGHGDSERSDKTEYNMTLPQFAKDLNDLIEHLGLKKVNMVGWSMGTSILLEYVRQYGCDNINKLCFIDMTPKLLTDDEWKLGQCCDFDVYANLGFMELVATDWSAATNAFIPNLFVKTGCKDPELFDWVMEQANKNTPHCMLNMWIAMATADYRDILKNISVPTLLTYSADGILYGPEHGEYMNKNIPNSKLVLFPNCGHGLFLEDHEKFNKELDEFLK